MEDYLIEHCSPTLASLKTANLFNYTYSCSQKLQEDLRDLNLRLSEKGVSVTVLRNGEKRALIYVYRKKKLEEDLNQSGVRGFLKRFGYEDTDFQSAIRTLKKHFENEDAFPHEIGIFLGYPLDDVIGFIENAGRNSKCSGCWKVYCNECEAVKLFSKFEKCKMVYKRLFNEGKTVKQLTVAV